MTASALPTPSGAPRSTFVTVLGCFGLAAFSFKTLASIVPSLLAHGLSQDHNLEALLPDSLRYSAVLDQARTTLGHMQIVGLANACVAVFGVIASIGLLRRRNWARVSFLVLLGSAIAQNLYGFIHEGKLFPAIPASPIADDPTRYLYAIAHGLLIGMVVLTLGLTVIYGWLIVRLLSEAIRAEFTAGVA